MVLEEQAHAALEEYLDLKEEGIEHQARIGRAYRRAQRLYDLLEREQARPDDWDWLLACRPGGEQSDFRRKELHKRISWTTRPISVSGYNPETNQLGLQIAIPYNCYDTVDRVYTQLKDILPSIKASPEEDGREPTKHINIFEYTLSEHGSYVLLIKNLNEAEVCMWRWRHLSSVKKGTLRKMLGWISLNLPETSKDVPY